MFNSNIWPNSAALRDISLGYLCDLGIDVSRSLKVKCDSVIGLPIYVFIEMFNNSSIWPNSAPLQDIRLRNLEFDTSRSLKVKGDDVIGLAIHSFIHGFLLIYTVITCLTLTA